MKRSESFGRTVNTIVHVCSWRHALRGGVAGTMAGVHIGPVGRERRIGMQVRLGVGGEARAPYGPGAQVMCSLCVPRVGAQACLP